jgi:translation initiation factor eIF-2B subunit alpha
MADLLDSLVTEFESILQDSPHNSVGIAAFRILTAAIARSEASTFMGVDQELSELVDALQNRYTDLPIHFRGAAQIFRAGMTNASATKKGAWKAFFLEHANELLSNVEQVLNLIPRFCSEFLQHGMTILTHGFDPIVALLIEKAASDGRKFHVVVTEGRPRDDGVKLAETVKMANVEVTVIPDSAIGVWMNEADAVLVGTDLVLEDGGLLAPLGTYTLCVLASVHRCPVYCVCETFKFTRKFILSANDLVQFKKTVKYVPEGEEPFEEQPEVSAVDYTPAKFVTLLLTEKGPMPPSAVTAELTNLLGTS